jgi:hypothetical protein
MVARPDSTEAILADLLRRVSDLETAERLTNASMKAGRLRVLDADGVTRVEIGTLSDWGNGDGDYGVAVLTPTGQPILVVDQDGQFAPWTPLTFSPLQKLTGELGFMLRDTTTFNDFARADVWVTAKTFRYDLQLDPLAAGSMEWQIVADPFTATPTTVIVSGTEAPGSSIQRAGNIDLTSFFGADVVGAMYSFKVQAKRTGGSGAVGVRFNTAPILRP